MGEEDPEQVQVTSAEWGGIEGVGTVELVHVGGLLMMDGW